MDNRREKQAALFSSQADNSELGPLSLHLREEVQSAAVATRPKMS